MSESRAKAVLGGGRKSKPSGKQKVTSVHVRRGHSHGFIVTNHLEPDPNDPGAPTTQENPVADQAALQAHIAQHLGDQPAAPAPAAPDAGAAAAGGGAPAAPSM